MTVPNSFFKNRVIAVPVVRVLGKAVTILGTPRGNWISLSFENVGPGINGNWRFGPIKGDLIGSKTK